MRKVLLPLLLSMAIATFSYSQTVTTDSLSKRITNIEETIAGMKKIKFSGYLQMEWQKAEAPGIKSYAAGNFEPNMDNRFLLRRSRLKMTYTSDPVLMVIQIDALTRDAIIRDAYGAVKLPGQLKNISLQGGLFNRPFGYDLQYSSSKRETPERARVNQTILPDERDLGFKLVYHKDKWQVEGGLFNGNAIALENDSKKDFIGRISTTDHEYGNLTVGGGVSYYDGFVREGTNKVFDFEKDHFIMQDTLNGSHIGQYAKRQYYGGDVQLSFPWAAGRTTIRAEGFYGTQPGSATSSTSPKTAALPTGDTYIRPFIGGQVYFIQNLGKSNFQAVAKYDFYDPNREVSGEQIGVAGSLLNEGDLKYTTLGLGLNYYYKSVTFMAYYDMVKNETTSHLGDKYKNNIKDNVLTLRVQFRY